MSGLSAEFILRHDSDVPYCSNQPRERRVRGIENLGFAAKYATGEGMDDPKRGILFGNWNEFSRRAVDLLERAGYAIEWEDEWTTCADCGAALRTSPDSYGWQPQYIETDDGYVCFDCADFEEYLESIEDNPRKCCFRDVNPEEYGYTRISEPGEFESGWHPGQNDDPAEILERLHATGHQRIVFRVSGTGQFDISFETWERVTDTDDQ